MSEKCDRCGSVGQDRRTLKMACFYEMSELGLPFEQFAIHGVHCEKVGEDRDPTFRITLSKYAEPKGEPQNHHFYSLRVCKRCRGEWMGAIQSWFRNIPQGEDDDEIAPKEASSSPGSGIFVRRLGTTVEISREEWDRLNPGREPVVVRSSEEL